MEKQHAVIYLEEYDKLKKDSAELAEVKTELKLREQMLNSLEQAAGEMIKDHGGNNGNIRDVRDYFAGHMITIEFDRFSSNIDSRVKFTYAKFK